LLAAFLVFVGYALIMYSSRFSTHPIARAVFLNYKLGGGTSYIRNMATNGGVAAMLGGEGAVDSF
jgi:hypothetical protein